MALVMALPSGFGNAYGNPFRDANYSASRVDMGVDFAGTGPIMALGPGTIVESDHSWAGAVGAPVPGTWIAEKLDAGPLKGKTVYLAEDVISKVRPGQHVDANTIIGYFTGSGLVETGYAVGPSAPGETLAAQAGQAATGGDPGAFSTAYGVAYNNVLKSTGTKSGSINRPIAGHVPKNWPMSAGSNITTTSSSGGGGSGGFIGGLLGGALSSLFGGTSWKDTLERFGLIVLGGALILVGIFMLTGKQALNIGVTAVAPEAKAASKGAAAAKPKAEVNE